MWVIWLKVFIKTRRQMCTSQFGQWLAVQRGHMVKGIHYDQASRMCSGQQPNVVMVIHCDQASLMCIL